MQRPHRESRSCEKIKRSKYVKFDGKIQKVNSLAAHAKHTQNKKKGGKQDKHFKSDTANADPEEVQTLWN